MDLAQLLLRLWRLKAWVGGAAVAAIAVAIVITYDVSISPPAISRGKATFGAASSEILVDSPKSSLADLRKDLQPLVDRASIYADFLKSEPVKAEIARRAGIPGGALVVRGQSELQAPATDQPASAYGQGADAPAPSGAFSVTFRQSPDSPILQIFSSGPTGAAAIRLADAAASGVSAYMAKVQIADHVAPAYRVQVRQLGRATGGDVSTSSSAKSAVIVAFAVFIALCLALLIGNNLRLGIRSARRLETAVEPYAGA